MNDIYNTEQIAVLLSLLKTDLQLLSSAFDNYLMQLLSAAVEFITREGIKLTNSAEDMQLVQMYAAYLYRKRAHDDPVMPRMLRFALNNRLFSQKMSAAQE